MRAICGIQLYEKEGHKHLMLMLDFNEGMDQLGVTSSEHWYVVVIVVMMVKC